MEYTVKDILHLEVAPALGCTEPTAIALGGAAAASLLPVKDHDDQTLQTCLSHKNRTDSQNSNDANCRSKPQIDSIEIWLDPNIFKNGLAVAIPGTGGLSGLDLASAIGTMAGDPMLRMEVLLPINDQDVQNASEFIQKGKVKVHLLSGHRGLYVKTAVKSGDNLAVSTIEVLHDNITTLELNGQTILEHALYHNTKDLNGNKEKRGNAAELEKSLKQITMNKIIALADQLDSDDLDFIERGIEMNMALAHHGLEHACGLQVGTTLDKLADKGLVARDMIHDARVLTAAAGDARMSGARLPAMSSAGSGNHGLTAIIPIKAVADHINAKRDDLCKAVGLSHIITACIKAHTGRLAAICACSVAAGAGAAAGTTLLFGGTPEQIGAAVENIIEDLAGVICDGAKNSCALKLDTAAGAAVQAALFALNGLNVKMTDGIVGETPEKTIRNIGILSSEGMVETDRVILKIMLDKILK
ncbi:MAG: serine dehydratase subunit alpha family protein [Desulfamplus sp.]|nr:serine dehydratase subunit alpha family protein [Desulfamplus sp.]